MRGKWPRRSDGRINIRPKFNVDRLKVDETIAEFQSKIEQSIDEYKMLDVDVNQMVRQKQKSYIRLRWKSSPK